MREKQKGMQKKKYEVGKDVQKRYAEEMTRRRQRRGELLDKKKKNQEAEKK